jgi:hypothetical protein
VARRSPLCAGLIAFAITLIALAIEPATAPAASSRAEYVTQVVPICQSAKKPVFKAFGQYYKRAKRLGGNDASDRALRGPTSHLYTRWASIYGRVTGQIAAISPAPGDEQIVATWLADRGQVRLNLIALAHAVRHGKDRAAKRITRQGSRFNDQTNEVGRTLGLPTDCAPKKGNLWEFD